MELHPAVVAEMREVRSAIKGFVASVQEEDPKKFVAALGRLECCGGLHNGWQRALRSVALLPPPSDQFRARMLGLWVHVGDALRSYSAADLALIDALAILLPSYRGPDRKLFRGESAHNRRRRTYGMSWSMDIAIARGFAHQTLYRNGTVVLEADVPAAAIISGPGDIEGFDGEAEYLVDRRRLRSVRVIERLPAKPFP